MSGAISEEDRIKAALSHIPADDREVWVQMGMAIKSELGEAGFDFWDDWSRSASSYSESDAKSVWKSFRSGGITIASLFKRAIEHGYCESEPTTPLSAEERDQRRIEREREAAAAAEGHRRSQTEAAAKTRDLWEKAGTVHADHAYVRAKRIKPYGAKQLRDQIVVKLQDIDGGHHSSQYIQPAGGKTFQTGGRVSGCFVAVTAGAKPGAGAPLLIAEGYATACSLHEATGYPVAAAMNAGNLLSVAQAWRDRHPKLEIIICADDDTGTDGNPGMTKATEAARVVGGVLAVPDFGQSRPAGATDFNDLHCLAGLEAVKRCILAATAPGGVQAKAKRAAPAVVLSRASEITPEAITWLWPGYLPAGKLTILAGQPGCGKTTIALSLAAAVTTGGLWPDGAQCTKPGNVLVWTGEDGIADTLVPRLMAAGADLARVWFAESVADEEDHLKPFNPARDIPLLSERIAAMGDVRMVIVDPIISVVQGDGHKSIDVRLSLQPLLDLGAIHNCAIFGITHFSKGSKGSSPLDRILGSQAFGAAARVILIAGKDDSSGRRVFAKSKANIADETGGFEYAIDVIEMGDLSSSRIQWGEPLTGSARDILREIEADDAEDDGDGEQQSKFERARAMIYELLRPFASTRELKAAAAADGMSWRTVEAAKQAEISSGAKIRAVKQGKEWGWIWDNFAANHPAEASAQVLDFPDFGNDRRSRIGSSAPETPEASPQASSPQRINSANSYCGVESQAQQGFQAKSATPQSIQGPPRVHAHAHTRAHAGVPKTHCGLADLTESPSPARESSPQSSFADLNNCGLESGQCGVDDGNVRGDL
ncbi:AAA family ATPase [Burkholderia gladioli]|uniref:AAA family ATPase n=1 Tax=Burkholderia gladioli TaxID=28095 RepID=UPI000D008576|nr:AAA family ATPase [Burkholderia gladioli]PRE91660.1 topoisomerase [Burkholderia gladioli]